MKPANEKRMDVYPWAAPTPEQKRMFDALPYDEQLKMVQDALAEGLESGISDKSVDQIFEEILSSKPS
jgi:hypothetical protein